jgi:sugar phosphate isomerase/epimerase
MIYVSSSCVKAKTIGDAVRQLHAAGFQCIELSGGTQPYPEMENELRELQAKYGLRFLCHNYFPPPSVPFVVNLASLNDQIYTMTMEHLQRAVQLSKLLNADKFGFHAGFLMDIPTDEIGRSIAQKKLFDRHAAIERFRSGFLELQELAGDLKLYVENNVVSQTNLRNFEGINPLLATDLHSIRELRGPMSMNFIIDVAHLKVSCNTLGLNFTDELSTLLKESDYIHISDNDGAADTNQAFIRKSGLYEALKRNNLKGKTFTLEVYSGMKDLISGYEALNEII